MPELPQEIKSCVKYAEIFRNGLPVVSGGVLDQSQWFLEATSFLWNEQAINALE